MIINMWEYMYGRDAVDAAHSLTTTSTYITTFMHACILYRLRSTKYRGAE